ncbi:MAG: arylsulfatase [Candidatus Obscuribacterales bacterium]|nr:arylsulfatase [Candidatus Obscuribacterales bacterium]
MYGSRKKSLNAEKCLRACVLALSFGLASPLLAWADESGSVSMVPLDRTVLPLTEPHYPNSTVIDARNTKAPPRFEVQAPKDAPNVLVILVDDMGFGQPSAFGGPVHMPNFEKLAGNGIKYNDFHTTALCSPSRAALLTGRNHHRSNMGSVTETATGFPGQSGQRPNDVAPLAEMLRLNGYSTAAFGKSHETAAWELSPSGPTDRWPTRSGFDKFYGFIGGETNQWAPLLYDGMSPVELPKDKNYHFLTDMTDQSIKWMRSEKSLTPKKPFFIYYAPGATHAPHHVPAEWIAKYKGKFDQGWDKVREETLARQIALGVVPAGTKLAPKPEGIKNWDELSADEKKLFAHQMEVFAGYGEFCDYEAGRLLKAIEDMGQLDNTLVFFIAGDNGASAEGGFNGLFNEMTYFNGVQEQVADILKHYDDLGSDKTYNHYAAGWAVAGDSPCSWTKQVASSYGGTRNGVAIQWPKGIHAKSELRPQFHHIIDIAPTILEAAGLPEPKVVNGTPQLPIEGVSMLYTFDDAKAPSRHHTQYFEIFGNRGIYHDGWLAGTVHRAPWEMKSRSSFENDRWELYNAASDFSLAEDLAAKNPEKLQQMKDLFMSEAVSHGVLPLDDRFLERTVASAVGRPDLMAGRKSLTLYDGMTAMSENVFINSKNQSYTISADLEIPASGSEGVILAQAGRFGGWSLYLEKGKPVFTYNFLGLEQYSIKAKTAVPTGKVNLRYEFAYDGGGPGKGGIGSIFVNDKKVAEGRIEKTQANFFSADEGADVGMDLGTAVSSSYQAPFKFTGKINRVRLDLKSPSEPEKAQNEKAKIEGLEKKTLSD